MEQEAKRRRLDADREVQEDLVLLESAESITVSKEVVSKNEEDPESSATTFATPSEGISENTNKTTTTTTQSSQIEISYSPTIQEDVTSKATTVAEASEKEEWLPPSVTSIESPLKFETSIHHSAVPQAIKDDMKQSVVLGVDEAGRGPVMGPMVYGVAYCAEAYSSSLKSKYGFADSKTLKEDKRRDLFKMIEGDDELHQEVGWCTTTMTARDISGGMLRSSIGRGSYNLNEQAHDTTIELIKQVLAKGVNVTKIYVDTVGPPESYARKLRSHFPGIEITVAKKADSIYPIVSTASVVAKVTRDYNLNYFNKRLLGGSNIGSGYPSDPNTTRWFNANVDKVFGWCFGLIRFSWQTSKDSLERAGAVNVIYEDKCVKPDGGYQDVSLFFAGEKSSKIDKSYYSLSDDIGI